MNRFDDSLLISRLLRRAISLLPSLFLMAFFSISGATSSGFAQTTAEVCRESAKVEEQLEREHREALITRGFIKNEEVFREILSGLNKGIANGRVEISGVQIPLLVAALGVAQPGATTKERLAFQRTVRPLLERALQVALSENRDDVELRVSRLQEQIILRINRRRDLNCDEVLAAEPSGGKMEFLGCFKDSNKPFDLDGFLERSSSNTPESCVAKCRAKGFAYAGVQYGQSCLCGNSFGKQGKSTACNMKCTGDSTKICGGLYCNSVYGTGIVPK